MNKQYDFGHYALYDFQQGAHRFRSERLHSWETCDWGVSL